MLTKKQVKEIKEYLEKAQNPIFYYDNDADGLCSFLLLRRYLKRGRGIVVKSYPDLDATYAHKANEMKADCVFILDKPLVSEKFLEAIDSLNIPVVWIDHHKTEERKKEFKNLHIYNPTKNKGENKSSEPVTFLIYQVTKRKEDLWLAVIGCIADHYLPEFSKDFAEQYPELWGDVKEPFDAYYKTDIGKIAQAFSFGLKNSASNVISLQNVLINCNAPEEVFAELESNKDFRDHIREMRKKYEALIEKARENINNKLIFFEYGGDLSISAELANELSYYYPKKYIAIAYSKNTIINISLRGKNVRKILEKIINELENASGGGHKNAVGARIKAQDIERFKQKLAESISNGKPRN